MGRKQQLRLAIVSAIVVFLCRKLFWRYSCTGKRIVITGGSCGLGLAISRRLAREGGILAILARNAEELARAKADLEQHGGSIAIWRCDVTDNSAVQSIIKKIGETWDGIDVVVNCAGEIVVGPLSSMTSTTFCERN